MHKYIISLLLFFVPIISYAQTPDELIFNKVFAQWTAAFNQKNLPASCDLFSKSVIANYRGVPTKNYSMICDGFKKIFSEKNKKYHYRFKILTVYRANDLAVVRIRWYLSIFSNGKLQEKIQDEGMDVLQKNADGKWRIVNYLAYSL